MFLFLLMGNNERYTECNSNSQHNGQRGNIYHDFFKLKYKKQMLGTPAYCYKAWVIGPICVKWN